MRIKKIEIEGFKSYSQCEVVDNLDPEFNAITGLNGSGKSNILDAICFLLGITNLSHVRAQTLTDLVFKQGQAGISRATVTITFDNNVQPAQQPAGYAKYKEIVVRRQIIINGRNTYQINGTAATNQRVSDLFRTVGINVNNPHFLIQQGRITKMLNMKPMEILSMVEEAAGVRMYECKKQSALRTISKKEDKLQEIKRLLEQDIHPKVQKMQKNRDNYVEYQKIEKELEVFGRKLIAYDFYTSNHQVSELERKAELMLKEIQTIGAEIDQMRMQLKSEQKKLQNMEAEKAKNLSSELEKFEKAHRDLLSEQTRIESERDAKEASVTELQIAINRKKEILDNDRMELENKKKQLAQMESVSGGDEKRGNTAEMAVMRARQKMEALAKGMTTDERGNAVTLEAQLIVSRSQLSERETDITKAEMRLNQLQKMLQKKNGELEKFCRRSNQKDSKRQLEEEIFKIEQQIQKLNFNPERERQLEEENRHLLKEKGELANKLDAFEAKFYNLQFNYKDPYNDFDRNKVKGVLARLFKLKDPKFATALEVAASGKIYNVVIDKAETGNSLLNSGLQKRVTLIPLDKINSHELSHQQINKARQIVGSENALVPRELIEYEHQIEPAIKHAFGNCLICVDMEQAKRLTFDRAVNCRTVTLTGEDFRPSGQLTGGSRSNRQCTLQALDEVTDQYQRIAGVNQRLKEVESQLANLKPIHHQFDHLNNQLEACRKRLEIVVDTMKTSPEEVLRHEIAQAEEEISQQNEIIKKCSPEVELLRVKVKELEEMKKNEKEFQEREKKRAQSDLADALKELELLKGTFSNAKERLASLREEIGALEGTIQEDDDELKSMMRLVQEKQNEVVNIEGKIVEINEKVRTAQQELDKYNKETRSKDKVIQSKAAEIEDMKKGIRQLEAKGELKDRDAHESASKSKEFAKRAQQLEKAHKWIAEEKSKFGLDSEYNFQGYNYEIGKREIEKRKERSKELQQNINTRAMHLLDTAEEQCHELESKCQQLERDKKQLYEAIEQLDEKKKRELIAAHGQISADFGSIYSTLLPGAHAELVPPSGAENCLEGLEVRVAFNGKYKEALTELSGGQRSLVALSLILAMLKFKPAPFYILDEIDAALDISHTENIGKMIKNHFSQSQFIVVSLKQGFFDNANVVYRVQFKEGRSTVARTENRR